MSISGVSCKCIRSDNVLYAADVKTRTYAEAVPTEELYSERKEYWWVERSLYGVFSSAIPGEASNHVQRGLHFSC